jgi:hypothetical protein
MLSRLVHHFGGARATVSAYEAWLRATNSAGYVPTDAIRERVRWESAVATNAFQVLGRVAADDLGAFFVFHLATK